jgi:hypothetical protein
MIMLKFIIANILNLALKLVDLLFINMWYIYVQLEKELKLYGNISKKYIALHDTNTFVVIGENGLTILEREI